MDSQTPRSELEATPQPDAATTSEPVAPDSVAPDPVSETAAPEAEAIDSSSEAGWGPLHPLPRGLVELYGLLAVLFVLVPEWMAGSALFGFRETRDGSLLPPPSGAWKRLPELRLASLTLSEMRLLARQLALRGYSRNDRAQLTARLLKRMRKQG